MKINISENELKDITFSAIKKAVSDFIIESKTIKKNSEDGYLKANRAGSREAEREINGNGFKQITKVHKSIKDYSRKGRNKDSWKKQIDENDENEISYKTTISARNNAVNSAYDNSRINGSYGNNAYERKLRQINSFQNYLYDNLKKIIGTKVQVIIDDGFGFLGKSFYTGIIKNIKEITQYEYSFLVLLYNEFGDKNDKLQKNIIIDFHEFAYDNSKKTIEGITDDGNHADLKFSNKQARLLIANLINKNGDDEYLKTIR